MRQREAGRQASEGEVGKQKNTAGGHLRSRDRDGQRAEGGGRSLEAERRDEITRKMQRLPKVVQTRGNFSYVIISVCLGLYLDIIPICIIALI